MFIPQLFGGISKQPVRSRRGVGWGHLSAGRVHFLGDTAPGPQAGLEAVVPLRAGVLDLISC